MRTAVNNSTYKLITPGRAVYSKAGNYMEWTSLAASITNNLAYVLVYLRANGVLYPFKVEYNQGERLILRLDAFIEYVLATSPALAIPRVEVVSFSFYDTEGVQGSGASPSVWFDIIRASMPWGSELPFNGTYVQDSFATPLQYVYPGLPYTFDVIVGTFSDGSSYFLNFRREFEIYSARELASGNRYQVAPIDASAVPSGVFLLYLSDGPQSLSSTANMPIIIDECREGFLVCWRDPSGVRKAYRFPKGTASTQSESESKYCEFSDYGEPLPRDKRKASRVINLQAPYINAETRAYIEGLARSSEVSVLDLQEWEKDNTKTPTRAIVRDCDTNNNGRPLQTWSFTLEYDMPTL